MYKFACFNILQRHSCQKKYQTLFSAVKTVRGDKMAFYLWEKERIAENDTETVNKVSNEWGAYCFLTDVNGVTMRNLHPRQRRKIISFFFTKTTC